MMTKNEFLRKLKMYLQQLDEVERDEILAFYEERFERGDLYEAKTEREIIDELESPVIIAENVLKEYGMELELTVNKREPKKIGGREFNINPWSIAWLIVYDFLIAAWALPAVYGLAISLSFSLLSILSIIPIFMMYPMNLALFLALIIVGVEILLGILAYLSWLGAQALTTFTIALHIRVLRPEDTLAVEKTKNFRVVGRKQSRKRNSKMGLVLSLGIVLIVVSGFFLITSNEDVIGLFVESPENTETYTFDASEFSNDLAITIDFINLDVEIKEGTTDDIIVEYVNYDLEDVVIDIEEDELLIRDLSDDLWSIFNMKITKNEIVTVYLPSDLMLAGVFVDITNGDVTLEEMDCEFIRIDNTNGSFNIEDCVLDGSFDIDNTNGIIGVKNTQVGGFIHIDNTNGLITLNNVETDDFVSLNTTNSKINLTQIRSQKIEVDTTNGKIILRDIVCDDIILENTNGDIQLEDIETINDALSSLDMETTNGNIHLENVYINSINGNTTNGTVFYENEDLSYHPRELDLHTTNGDYNVNVSYE